MPLTRAQYEKISSEYDYRRTRALTERNERLAKIRTEIPEYAESETRSAEVAAEYSKRFLEDPETDLGEMDTKLSELSEQRRKILRDHGYNEDYVDIRYTCPDCKDTGYIDGVKCHCFKQAEIELLYNRSGINRMLSTENFDHLRTDMHKDGDLARFNDAVTICHRFIDEFDTCYSNLMFCGTVGTGKSFLSCCIAKELIDTGHSVIYLSAVDFFKLYGDMMYGRNRDSSEDVISPDDDLFTSDLLVLDDLGTELSTQYACTALFSLLSSRHNAGHSTIVNTNLSLQELHDRYSERVFSRLTGYYTLIKLTGPDLRLVMRQS